MLVLPSDAVGTAVVGIEIDAAAVDGVVVGEGV
jgi:hypothetical protein